MAGTSSYFCGDIASLGGAPTDRTLVLVRLEGVGQARPTLWRYGDAGHLDPKRSGATQLPAHEWITCLCIREEMEYTLPSESEPFRARREEGSPEVNRFAGDWVTLHMFATLYYLTERRPSAFAFLQNGGMKLAEGVRHLMPEALAESARAHTGARNLQSLAANPSVPQMVRHALNVMQQASADVLGMDGHRLLCRHEGVAYMATFGCPLIFTTPNLLDTKQMLLMVVEVQEVWLDASSSSHSSTVLPKYHDMMQRVALDPVGQTVCLELVMRLLFIHVLGIRVDCVSHRRGARPREKRNIWDWCTDGLASSSTTPGIFGLVLAFRGEIEAQGRGSLHPHVLVWLAMHHSRTVIRLLRRQPDVFRERLGQWMKACVAAVESTCQSSVEALPRRFGR